MSSLNIQSTLNDNNFSWKYLCYNTDKISKETDILINRSKLVREIILKSDPHSQEDCTKILGILADDTFEFNNFHSLSKLLRFVSPNKDSRDSWLHTDRVLDSYIEKFNADEEIFKKIKDIPNKYLDNTDKLFIGKIMKCFSRYGLINGYNKNKVSSVQRLYGEIIILENKIIKNIHSNQFVLNDLSNLIRIRDQYSKLLQCENYANLISEIDIINLQKTLKNIISSSHEACYNELHQICTSIKSNRVSIIDIMQYVNKVNNKHTVTVKTAVNYMFDIIGSKFNLEFIKMENAKAWHDDVIVYIVKFKNEVYGYIYVDLYNRSGKLPNVLSIILNEAVIYPYNSGILKTPVTALISNFNHRITYFDIISMFKEMGQIIYAIFHRSKYEATIESNLKSVIPHIFECIARDVDNIKILFDKNYNDVYNAITVDRAFKLKYKCINTLYDYLLHGSYTELNDKMLYNKYCAIAKSVLNKSYDQFIIPSHLPLDVVVQLIYNGGMIYSDVTNNIMAFNLYNLLKEKNNYDQFTDIILRESAAPFKSTIASFINTSHENKTKNQVFIDNDKENEYNESLSDDEQSCNDSLANDVLCKYISDNTNYFTETDINCKNKLKISKR